MRNISQFAVSMVLLASQVSIPLAGDITATASSSQATVGVSEVKLNTANATAIELVGAHAPDYEVEVLAPLHEAQAQAAAAKVAAKAARTLKARQVAKAAPAVKIAGSHADWMRAAGIAESDFGYVDYIIGRESGWGVTKSNYRGSGAYGLGQALPASKMAKFGSDYLTNPVTQLRWANAYAVGKFGSWAKAYNYWLIRHSW